MNTSMVTQRFNNSEQIILINTSEMLMQTRIENEEGGLKLTPIGTDGVLSFQVPGGEVGSVAFVGGSHLAISKRSKKKKEAFELLN